MTVRKTILCGFERAEDAEILISDTLEVLADARTLHVVLELINLVPRRSEIQNPRKEGEGDVEFVLRQWSSVLPSRNGNREVLDLRRHQGWQEYEINSLVGLLEGIRLQFLLLSKQVPLSGTAMTLQRDSEGVLALQHRWKTLVGDTGDVRSVLDVSTLQILVKALEAKANLVERGMAGLEHDEIKLVLVEHGFDPGLWYPIHLMMYWENDLVDWADHPGDDAFSDIDDEIHVVGSDGKVEVLSSMESSDV